MLHARARATGSAQRSARITATTLGAFSRKQRGLRARAAAIGVLVGLATPALMLAPQAASAAGRTYSATISPTVAQIGSTATGSTATYTVTIKNKGLLASLIGKKTARITVPSGFTNISVGAPSPSFWTASTLGNTVTLTSRSLLPGSSVSVPITATAPTAPGGYTWATTSSGVLGPFTRVGPDPSVTVGTAAAVVVCNPNNPCSSPTLSAGASPTALATDAQVTAQSGPQADVLSVVLPDPTAAQMLCQQTTGNFGQIVTWNVTARTSTLVYTVHPTTIGYTYDLSDTCFGSTQPFLDASGNPAVQNPLNGNEYEGTLPFCSTSTESGPVTNPPPCVESIVSTPFDSDNDGDVPDSGDDIPIVTVTVDAPRGDPKFTG